MVQRIFNSLENDGIFSGVWNDWFGARRSRTKTPLRHICGEKKRLQVSSGRPSHAAACQAAGGGLGWLLTPHSETCCPGLLVILTSMAYVSLLGAYDTLVSSGSPAVTRRCGPEMFLTYSDTRPVNQNKHLSITDERGLLPGYYFEFSFFLNDTWRGGRTRLWATSQLKETELKSSSIRI